MHYYRNIFYMAKISLTFRRPWGKLNTVMTKPIPKTCQHTGINPPAVVRVSLWDVQHNVSTQAAHSCSCFAAATDVFSPLESMSERMCFVNLSLRVTSARVCVRCGILTHINLRQWQRCRYVTVTSVELYMHPGTSESDECKYVVRFSHT